VTLAKCPLDLWYYLNYNWDMGSKIGRPRTGRKPNFSIRIDPAALKQARAAAITQKKTLGRWLEEAIAGKIGREKKPNKEVKNER
jgi:predicted HicB family RNase H-like nuclease